MRKRTIIKRILRQPNSRQSGVVKRSAVRAAGPPAVARCGSHESPIGKRHHGLANHVRCRRWPKYACASRLPGAGINVEIRIQFRVLRLLVFKTAKMLLHVRQRAEQSLFFAAPQRNANRPPWFHVQRRQNPHCFQHHRGADAVVRSSRRVMPRIVMAAQHDDLVFLVRAGNFSNRVVSGRPLGVFLVLNIDAQRHGRPITKKTRDSPIVFIAHH